MFFFFLLISDITLFMRDYMAAESLLEGYANEAKAERSLLMDCFQNALLASFPNGGGRDAVSYYFITLTSVVRNIKGGDVLPVLNVKNVSSTANYYSFNYSESSSLTSPSQRRLRSPPASSEPTDPSRKRKRVDETSPRPFTGSLASCVHVQDYDFRHLKVKKHFSDLVITTVDVRLLVPKYVLIVDVLSPWVHPHAAERKMKKQLICVLQAQTEVFGIIFAPRQIFILRAVAKEKQGDVLTQCTSYNMYDDNYRINVAEMQRVTMDIFTVLVHGVTDMLV